MDFENSLKMSHLKMHTPVDNEIVIKIIKKLLNYI
jgi:hypothetical protein